MAFRLSKAADKLRADLVADLRKKYGAYEDAVAEFNNDVQPMFGKVEDAIRAFNDAVAEAKAFVDEQVGGWREATEDKSDKWQESDRGSIIVDWINDWENFGDEVIDMPDVPEIDVEGNSVADDLESLEPEPPV